MAMAIGKDLIALSQTRVPLWPKILWSSQKPDWVGMFSGSLWATLKCGTSRRSKARRQKILQRDGQDQALLFPSTSLQRVSEWTIPTCRVLLGPTGKHRWFNSIYRMELRTAVQKLACLEYIRRKTKPESLCVANLPQFTQALDILCQYLEYLF